ncbi:glycosyltransferase [Methanobacterium alcaliphilum]|uniref:glycosyltransferase n=1 Tax=Methanobacterium alcaliphilum TaxID=392018 RepID=UPI00200AF47A|nr:glycosyltransferase [Methanobacterium alcaliphilum]MCK9152620.1 glycosyltransferase [Methanobacterium alcaliphilum]
MKALFVITGRGMGGDAVTALNIARALSKKGVECEFALDHTAPGLLLKKEDIHWHKISIPQAGGHAATKIALAKAGVKTTRAALEAVKLIKNQKPDVLIGVIGGGAVVGCLSAKIAKVPAVGILITPMDAKVCTKLNSNIVLPESNLYQQDLDNERLHKAYSPINPEVIKGNKNKALEKMPDSFNPQKTTLLFSSGSSLFEKTAQAVRDIALSNIDANILVVGHPLKEEYLEYLENENIINLGYVDWIQDLYSLADVAVLTDDGVMIHEAIACKTPIVALTGVKYGRYHNMAAVFPGAVMESSLENLKETLLNALDNLNRIKEEAQRYGGDVLNSADKIADIIINEAKKGR